MPQRYLMPQKEHKALKDELGPGDTDQVISRLCDSKQMLPKIHIDVKPYESTQTCGLL